ncbi:MAG: PH domain-containing protein [Planctomycetes bacterium]|nr:PH domain-containing protein [Planctomycetota bacterium]
MDVDRTPSNCAPIDPRTITRPDPVLRTYYIIVAILTLPAVVITLPLLMFKYKSLRYRFDDEGIAMSWGILFRREMYLTYRRIQDIHVTRGIIQRWLGIATISVQTASGGMGSDMLIEGIVEYDALRDFLYRRMRGAHGEIDPTTTDASGISRPGDPVHIAGRDPDEALALLREIRDEIRRLKPTSGARS